MSTPPTSTPLDQWPTHPTLLTLPLEIRLNIYSFILLNKHPKTFFRSDMNISAYSLSTTCHQIKSEALAYYYRNNFFRLELADPERLPTRLAEDDGQQYKLLCAHMGRVQKLQLEMKVVNSRFYDVEQKEQLAWVCDALVWAKKGEKEGKTGSRTEGREVSKKLLKGLVVLDRQQVSGFRPSEFRNMEIAHIVSILEPLRGRVGGLMVFDQVIPFV